MREHGPFKADDIERVKSYTHAQRLPHTDRPQPKTALEAKFSVQYCVARAVLDGHVLMLDVDHFKTINDQWGHQVGDAALTLIAQTLRGRVRVFDSIARYGGEEFVVVMPGTGELDALSAAERLRGAIEELRFVPETGLSHRLTVSVGVACCVPGASMTPERLIQAADQALYAAKRAGRNRVEVDQTLGV